VDDAALLEALGRLGRRYAGGDASPVPLGSVPLGPVPLGRPGTAAVLVRYGSVVVKAHAAGTDAAALEARLALAAGPALAGVLLAPLDPRPVPVGDRLASVWPYGATVPVDPARVPWADAARLLARLHTAPPDAEGLAGRPACGAPERIAGLVAALPDRAASVDAGVVRAAWLRLPAWVRGEAAAPGPATLVHGDWHLGQLVAPAGHGWRLCDVDDLGRGAPVWDFARLAALRALGVVREEEFRGFLDAYWAAGGPALRGGTGWEALDAVARAQVVSAAARRLGHPDAGSRYPDGLNDDLLRVCARLAAGVE
jgi:aminoglycoside phosphotransferase (APT) family kinase protein